MTQRRYDKISVTVEGRDVLRRLAQRQGCSVSAYVRDAIADRVGTLNRTDAPSSPSSSEEGAPPLGRPLPLTGHDEMRASWVDGSNARIMVSIRDEAIIVGEPEAVIAAGWTMVGLMTVSQATPEVVARTDDDPDKAWST